MGIVKIKEKENAQQVMISIEMLERIGDLAKVLKKMKVEDVIITVEKNYPIVIGWKDGGFAYAPMQDTDTV